MTESHATTLRVDAVSLVRRARRLTVVVPTFNERDNLERLVGRLLGVRTPGVRLSVLIVDDSSPDGTGEVADALVARHPLRVSVLHRPRREGLGRAYVQAFGLALERGADLVLQMDADFSHDPHAIPYLLGALRAADMVLGSRFLPESRIEADWPRSRRLLAWFANSVYVRLLLGSRLKDMTGGFRLWRAETLRAMDLPTRIRSSGFVFQVEMAHVAQKLGFRVREVPITFAERVAGKSKMSLAIQLEAAWRAWELKWRFRRLLRRSDASAGAREEAMAAAAQARRRPDVWQRRYLLRHYRRVDDATLATGAGLDEPVVKEFLERRGALRTAGDVRRIEGRGMVAAPALFSPATARRAMTKLTSRPLTRLDAGLIAGLFLLSGVLYALTAARTVTGEDAGELLAAAHGFGVPHPPGYPLWLVLSWAADHLLPWGTVAWRVSLISALPAAAANAVLLAVALKTLRSRLAALAAAALFAVSLTHWTQAVIPEVYGLNTLFIGLQVLLLVRLAERQSAWRLLGLAAVSGLSATNHTSALPLGAVFAVGALLVAPQLFRRPAVLTGALLAGLLPLLLYFVLPLASARQPYVDWGNPETAEALWQHATRAQYAEVQAEQQATGSEADLLRRLSILADWAARQFGSGWVLLLALLGAGALFVRQTGLLLLLVAIGWLASVGITRYSNFPFEREHVYAVQIFWIPAWLALAWLLGGGIDVVVGALARPPARRAAPGLLTVGCAALVALPAREHFAVADRSRTTTIADFGRAILDAMEPGALYFPASDHSTFAVMYWQGVHGYRTDVTLADKYGRIEPEVVDALLDDSELALYAGLARGSRRSFEEFVLVRKWKGPVYFANRREMGDLQDLSLQPVGPVFKVMTQEEATAWWTPASDGARPAGLLAWERFLPLLDFDARERLDFTVQMIHADLLYMRGYAQLAAGCRDEALATWSRIEGDLAPLKQAFNNIGAALAEGQHLAEALPFYERARQEDPRYVLALRNEALVRRNLGDRRAAIDLLQQLLAVDADQRGARLELAHLLDDEDRPLEALAQYEALAVADKKDPAPWRDAGDLLARRGDRGKAEDAYREALRLAPGDEALGAKLEQLKLGPQDDLTGPAWPQEAELLDRAFGGLAAPTPPSLPREPASLLGFDRGLGPTARP